MKLESAGIDHSGIPIASANDHYSRIEIMKIAKARAGVQKQCETTYFGDGIWDQNASRTLGWNFILVGNQLPSEISIKDYTDIQWLKKQIGMESDPVTRRLDTL